MNLTLTLTITLGAPLLILLIVILSDKFREPIDLILKTFFMGILLCLVAGELNFLLIPSFEYSYIAGFTEETLKFLALFFYIRPKKAFNEPMDAIVYGTIISLGFATLENFFYVYDPGDPEVSSLVIAIVRSLSAIPLHATCGVIMGYFFGLYAFSGSRILLIKSLLIPMFTHAFYNYLTGSSSFLWLFLLLAAIFYASNLHKKLSNLQRNKTIEQEKKIINE